MSNPLEPRTWYVYLLCDPDTDAPFYVGKGSNERMFVHEYEARTGCDCLKCQRIRGIWASRKTVTKRIVFETFEEAEAFQHEEELIAKYASTLINVQKMTTRKSRQSPSALPFHLVGKPSIPMTLTFNGVDVTGKDVSIEIRGPNKQILMVSPLALLSDPRWE